MTHLAPAPTRPDVGPAEARAHTCDHAHCLSRRAMLRGAGAVTLGVAAAGVLAACGGGGDGGGGGGGGGSTPGGALAQVADVPVGGAVSAEGSDGEPLIIAQPTEGTIVAYSAVCTHMRCTVAPGDDELTCPCHGSAFAIADGAVINGPAEQPLEKVDVHVENGEVLLGA